MWPIVRAGGMGAIDLLGSPCPWEIHQSAAPCPTLNKPLIIVHITQLQWTRTEMQLLGIGGRASNSIKGKLKSLRSTFQSLSSLIQKLWELLVCRVAPFLGGPHTVRKRSGGRNIGLYISWWTDTDIKGYAWVCAKSLQLCPTLCDTMDCSLPGSSVHGILQARILEWIAMLSARGPSWPRDWTPVSCTAGRFFTTEPQGKPSKDCNRHLGLHSWKCLFGYPEHPFPVDDMMLEFLHLWKKNLVETAWLQGN